MSFLKRLANGLGTILGALADTAKQVISEIRTSYEAYRQQGGAVQTAATDAAQRNRDKLREVNEEIMDLRSRRMSRGELSDTERRRWEKLRQERDELLRAADQVKEVKAAEKILDTEALIEKVEVDLDTSHVLQYNAFADVLGKKCIKCGRQMKLQWRQSVRVAKPRDFYWGCIGWYLQKVPGRCEHTEPLQRADYGLMTDTSAPEFSMTADEFGEVVSNPGTAQIIAARVNDLRSDLAARKEGVELATCPVHGEHMVLRTKSKAIGLLDAYFLACPYWQPSSQGCSFIEKLKSGSQLTALLKSETGRGIL